MIKDNHQLTGFLATTLPKIAFAIGALGIAATALLYSGSPDRFYFSYLTSFIYFLTLSLGGLFFVIIVNLVRAGWSSTIRRIPEHLMANLGLMAILFIPILFGIHHLFEWSHGAVVAHDHLLLKKSPFLNVPFFLSRAAFYFGVWFLLARAFLTRSVAQDTSGDENLTLKSQTTATFGVLLFAITLTFAVIDWIMSLTPHWYSTMFGVYMFAGSIISALAATILIIFILKKMGFLTHVIRTDHIHDLGKLMYGFNIFWTYIAFSQYFLIWYANIPEETIWFLDHFKGSWNTVGICLAVGHFIIPFFLFMSRHAKRNLAFAAFISAWFLVMQAVDVYWLIMPNISKSGVHIGLLDITTFLAIAGLYIGVLFRRMSRVALYPIRDPRLDEALHYENTH